METTNKDWRLLIGIILIVVGVLAFVGIFLGVTYPRPIAPADVVVLPKATEPPDDIVALGYESHFTGMFVELFMGAEVQTTISATASCVITPTGTYQPLESGGEVTCTLEAAGAPGRYTGVRNVTYTTGSLLWLINETDTTINVVEGSTAELVGGTIALGISDTLTLFFDSTDWIELSRSNN